MAATGLPYANSKMINSFNLKSKDSAAKTGIILVGRNTN